MSNNSLQKSRKLKYGSVALLFTAVVIVLVIALNVVVSALTQKLSLYVDMTSKDLYSVSDACDGMISSLIDTHKDDAVLLHYEIIFCSPFDTLENTANSKMIYEFARKLEAKYPSLISVECIDTITHPTLAEQYKTTTADTVKTTDVIVKSTNTGAFRKYAQIAFYVTDDSDGSIFAFNGELKFVSAFLQLAGEYNPVAVFLSGHGEEDASAMKVLFESAGFSAVDLDLQKGIPDEDIAPGELPKYAKVLIVNGPIYDYIGANRDGLVNEIAVIDNFLEIKEDGTSGNLMVFMNPGSAGKLPELETYLLEWGIEFGAATVKDAASSSSVDGQTVIATLPTEGLGASLHASLRSLSSVPLTIVRNACPIYQVFESGNGRAVSSVLTTTKSAEAHPADGEGEATRGQFDLMTVSRETRYINNEACYSYVLATSSTAFASATYMSQRQYGNSDILYAAMRAFGKDSVPIDIDFKVLDDIGLSISTQEANTWTAVLVTVVPVIMLVLGTYVYIRRKHL